MFPRPGLTIQTADRFLNTNPKHKTTMPIHAILSAEKDPPGLPVPVPVPQQILVLPNDHDIHMPIVFPMTFLHRRESTPLPTPSPRHISPPPLHPLPPPSPPL